MTVKIGRRKEDLWIGGISGIKAILESIKADETVPKFRIKEFSSVNAIGGGEEFVVNQMVLRQFPS